MESPSCNHCCSGKDISITYSECVPIALSIKHAISMLHIFICGLSGYTMFFTLFHKRYDFWKSSIEHKTCVRIFFTILSETFLILRRIQQDIIINVRKSSCKVGIYSCQILWDKNFIKKKSENYQMLNLMKIHCYRHFMFKSWYVPAIQVRILNGLYIDRFVVWKWLKGKP